MIFKLAPFGTAGFDRLAMIIQVGIFFNDFVGVGGYWLVQVSLDLWGWGCIILTVTDKHHGIKSSATNYGEDNYV